MVLTYAAVVEEVAGRRDTARDGAAPGHEPELWARLRRFLVLGADGAAYHVAPRDLTRDDAAVVAAGLAEDGLRVVAEILAVAEAGRAPHPEPGLFALALAAAAECDETRRAALAALPRVARTGAHLFRFAGYVQSLRGWGRGLRRAVGGWYNARTPTELVYQAVKHPALGGWTHPDLLRLGHPKAASPAHDAVYKWLVSGELRAETVRALPDGAALAPLVVLGLLRHETDPRAAARLIRLARLPREAVPPALLGSAEVWAALLETMPLGAMLRSLGTMSAVGLLTAGGDATRTVADRLGDEARVARSGLHPIGVLAARKAYARGQGEEGAAWAPVPAVLDALDVAFDAAVANVVPTGRRLRLALGVGPAMDRLRVTGLPLLSAREVTAAMALVAARVEPDLEVVAYGPGIVPVAVAPWQRLDEVAATLRAIPAGPADPDLAVRDALRRGVRVDAFVSLLGGTNDGPAGTADDAAPAPGAGDGHGAAGPAADPLALYREATGTAVLQAVVALGGDAGPAPADGAADLGRLAYHGFDATTPAILGQFVRGEL